MTRSMTSPVRERIALYGAPAGFLVTTLLHPMPGRDVTADLADVTVLWLALHVVQLLLIGGLAVTVCRMLIGVDNRAARVARAATIPFVAFYGGFDAVVGIGTGVLARHATGLTGTARDAVLEAGDTLFMHPLGFLVAGIGTVAWLVATIGASRALKDTAPRSVVVGLVVAGLLFGLTHVGVAGFGGVAGLIFAVRAHEQARAPRPSAQGPSVAAAGHA